MQTCFTYIILRMQTTPWGAHHSGLGWSLSWCIHRSVLPSFLEAGSSLSSHQGWGKQGVREATFWRSQVDTGGGRRWAEQTWFLQLAPPPLPYHPDPHQTWAGSLGWLMLWKHLACPQSSLKFQPLKAWKAAPLPAVPPSPALSHRCFAILPGFSQSGMCGDHNSWGRTRHQQPFCNCHWRGNTGANE